MGDNMSKFQSAILILSILGLIIIFIWMEYKKASIQSQDTKQKMNKTAKKLEKQNEDIKNINNDNADFLNKRKRFSKRIKKQ